MPQAKKLFTYDLFQFHSHIFTIIINLESCSKFSNDVKDSASFFSEYFIILNATLYLLLQMNIYGLLVLYPYQKYIATYLTNKVSFSLQHFYWNPITKCWLSCFHAFQCFQNAIYAYLNFIVTSFTFTVYTQYLKSIFFFK